ncbi:MAG: hypothetical protein LBT05_13990 [Planctomycetaceae bacterium]|jgi:hypothetical protein|nr:hypothetical protein [Planctomycetaceae bacterium]
MKTIVLNTDTLPLPIREKLHSSQVFLQERDGGVMLLPLNEGRGLRGIASQSKLTTEKLRAYKNEDKELDR